MEISKEKLMSVISESSSEMDEMAKYWTKKKPGKRVASSKLFDNEDNLIGYDMMVNPFDENPDAERVQIIFTCDVQKFMEDHPDVVEKLKQDYGSFRWANTKCPSDRPHRDVRVGHPLPGEEGEPISTVKQTSKDVATGEKYGVQQAIKRGGFNKIIGEEFGLESPKGVEFNKVLSKRSIPAIIVDDKRFIDRTTEEWTNDKVVFRTHSFNTYATAQDFLKTVVARIGGRETKEMDTSYLARQFNKVYSNWAEDKKNQKSYEGKTDVFQLDRRGFSELNLDVSLKMIFEIVGEKIGDNSFAWTINMTNKFGRKRPDEYRIANGKLKPITLKDGGYLDEGLISVTKTIQLDPNKKFDEQNTIMSDVAVSEGLRETIYDFKREIESIEPKSALKYATAQRSDIERVNEAVVKLSKDILNKIKK